MGDANAQGIIRGTLDLLILKTLSLESMHGWGISHRIQQLSDGMLEVNQGSLYPALQRLVYRGWLRTSWGTTERNRRVKYYELTREGRLALADVAENWRLYAGMVDSFLAAT